jgi:hypothetical protein
MTQSPAIPATGATRSRPRVIAAAILGAAVVNVAIFLSFSAAGADFENTLLPQPVGLPAVLFLTIVPMLVGLSGVALLSRRRPALIAAGQWVGPALALATIAMTVAAKFDALSFIALALMHVVVAIAVFTGLRAFHR